MRKHRVRALLMGGQACVLYGAAEFSRDTDLAIVADETNLNRLQNALDELEAEVIAVPPFALKYLQAGHAIHFRCRHPEAFRMRVDIMARMRGVDSFPKLWKRRTTFKVPDGPECNLLSLPDLVRAKKTQRDKDWPMIRRLVEAHYFANRKRPSPLQKRFWLRELRTPELLMEIAVSNQGLCKKLTAERPLLSLALTSNPENLEQALKEEEFLERARDRDYWLPLRKELEKLRHHK
jgi:hypothetical protein